MGIALMLGGDCLAAAPTEPATALQAEGVGNLYRVSADLYRSGQPDKKGFQALQGMGVRSVLNLREYHKDDAKAAGTDLELSHYPVAAGKLTEADVENCLRLLRQAPKPVLVHCLHGSDRTGTIGPPTASSNRAGRWRTPWPSCRRNVSATTPSGIPISPASCAASIGPL